MTNKTLTIYIAGDSTAEIKQADERPMSGWGEYLSDYLNKAIAVENHAMGGRSTKSFIDQGRFDTILDKIKAGDYLLIQFGHNDQKIEDPTRYTEPFGSYQRNLTYFINEAKEKKAVPVLLSSISRRVFKNDTIDRLSLGDYPRAMKEIADKEEVPFIDMNGLSADYLNQLGIEKSKELFLHLIEGEYPNYPEGLVDNTHFSIAGGKQFASMIANELIKWDERFIQDK